MILYVKVCRDVKGCIGISRIYRICRDVYGYTCIYVYIYIHGYREICGCIAMSRDMQWYISVHIHRDVYLFFRLGICSLEFWLQFVVWGLRVKVLVLKCLGV